MHFDSGNLRIKVFNLNWSSRSSGHGRAQLKRWITPNLIRMFVVWWRQLVFTGFRIFPGNQYSKYPRSPVLRCFSPVIGHVVDELLDIRLLTWNTSSFQFGLVRFRSHPTLHHLRECAGLHVSEERKKDQSNKKTDLAFLPSDFFMIPPCSGDHLGELQLEKENQWHQSLPSILPQTWKYLSTANMFYEISHQQLGPTKCCQFDRSKSSCLQNWNSWSRDNIIYIISLLSMFY